MAIRAFKQFAIQTGGTPQPLVGTWVTATTPPAAQDQGGNSLTLLPVNDSSMFQAGDWAYLVSAALANPERVYVQSVPDATHIKVRNLINVRTGGGFGVGDFVALAIAINSTFVQQVQANVGGLFIGTQGLVKAGLVKVVEVLVQAAVNIQPQAFSDSRVYAPNGSESSDFWIDGTTADLYLPSFGVS